MSSASRAVNRLRKQYRNVLSRMRELNSRLGGSACEVPIPPLPCQLEQLEPRLLLDGDPAAQQAIELFSVSPALFVENQGQWADASVRFVHNGSGANVAMTDAGPVFQMFRQVPKEGSADGLKELLGDGSPDDGLPDDLPGQDRFDPEAYDTQVLQFSSSFVGANAVSPVGMQPSETVFNYFIGDEADWREGVASYEVVAYMGVYAGVDLHAWGKRDSLKYEFHVAPGADWSAIQVRYDGIKGLSINEAGQLVVDLGPDWGQVIDEAPFIYQEIDGQQVKVAGRFVLLDEWTYSFEITGECDSSRPLIIDPDLAWSTYLGGSGDDFSWRIAVDASGNAFVTGYTYSSNLSGGSNNAGTNNSLKSGQDAFVAKVTSSGSLAWATYLGGSGSDCAYDIAVDASGNAYVTGHTWSSNFSGGSNNAGTNNSFKGGDCDAFVAKVTSSGSLVWATYLGGSSGDYGTGIAVDSSGNAYVMGFT